MRSSDRINLSCTDSLKSLLALSHSDVMIVELTESEVVVLMEREFVKRAALGGVQLWGKLAYLLTSSRQSGILHRIRRLPLSTVCASPGIIAPEVL
jgi:hypothetical protein